MTREITIPWYPQPRQAELIKAAGLLDVLHGGGATPPVARLIGYGGAAFGGKTDGLLGVGIIAAFKFPGCRVGFFRRTFAELEGPDGAIERSREILAGVTDYNAGRYTHTFPTGSRLYFHHCNNEEDRYNYQSQAWDILLIDEGTHFTWPIVDYLITRNRPTIDNPELVPFTAVGTNPGNIGHAWFSQVFDVLQRFGVHEQVKDLLTPNGQHEKTYFIPAFLEDNPIGLARDPEYAERLEKRDPDVARALRWGDWTVFAGQAFRDWSRQRHGIEPFELPKWWPRWRAVDYGFDHPFVAGWFALDVDHKRVIMYRTVSGREATDKEQAITIRTNTLPDETIVATYASPDMWERRNKDGVIYSTVDEYQRNGVWLTRADNDRLAGARKLHRLLADNEDGKPGLQVFETCTEIFQVMPILVRSKLNPEDVEKVDGDDAYDMLRYGLTNYEFAPIKQQKRQPHPAMKISVL